MNYFSQAFKLCTNRISLACILSLSSILFLGCSPTKGSASGTVVGTLTVLKDSDLAPNLVAGRTYGTEIYYQNLKLERDSGSYDDFSNSSIKNLQIIIRVHAFDGSKVLEYSQTTEHVIHSATLEEFAFNFDSGKVSDSHRKKSILPHQFIYSEIQESNGRPLLLQGILNLAAYTIGIDESSSPQNWRWDFEGEFSILENSREADQENQKVVLIGTIPVGVHSDFKIR